MHVVAQPTGSKEGVTPPPSAAARVSPETSVAAADTDAPATVVSVEKPLPHNINPRGPLAEIIKLVNSGVNESVLLAFVTNSVHTFDLGAEEIIYLNDIGVPAAVVTAMIQRDQELKGGFASPPGPPLPAPEPAPPAGEPMMPPPSNGSASYAVEAPLTPPDGAGGDSEEMFQDSLAPYGNWVDVAGYGQCWQPTVVVANPGWQPYFNCGRWVYSDCGWYWLSDYSWGWAPFHYGTWFRHASLGWCWVPGHTWGPSWVSWRYDNDYCGWAPLPPGAHFVSGVGLSFHGHHVGERDDLGLRPDHYHFVAWNHFHDRQLQSHRLPPQLADRVYDHATIATRISGDGHTTINNALPVSRVVAATGRPLHTVALREADEPAAGGGRTERFDSGNRSLAIYRARPDLAARRAGAADALQSGHPGSAQATAWGARSPGSPGWATESTSQAGTRQSSSLILRGAQSSAMRETAPPNSLVIVGSTDPRQRSASPQPSAASAQSAESDRNSGFPSSWARSASNPYDHDRAVVTEGRTATPQGSRGDWRGTVTSSPQPSWFNGNSSRPVASVGGGTTGESRNYSAVPWSSGTEVSRPTAPPSYVPQRTYSAPASSAAAYSPPARAQSYTPPAAVSSRPAPSAAPAAPAASSSSGRGSAR